MRGVVVSIQVAAMLAVVLVIAFALASYLYTTLYASLEYSYMAIVDAQIYPKDGGAEVKICFTTGGAGTIRVIYLEVGGKPVSDVRLYAHGGQTDAITAGSSGYIKADVNIDIQQVETLTGRVVTDRGFSFLFTLRVSRSEAKCPWE